jgi:signal transduction histidine kinase
MPLISELDEVDSLLLCVECATHFSPHQFTPNLVRLEQGQLGMPECAQSLLSISDVMSGVLRISELAAGRYTFEADTFKFDGLLDGVEAEAVVAVSVAVPVVFSSTREGDAGVTVIGPLRDIRSSILSVLDNAWRATCTQLCGSVSLHSKLAVSPGSGNADLEFTVSNSCSTLVPPSVLARALQPFALIRTHQLRRDGATTGTGLSLCVAKYIAAQNGGDLAIKSSVENGTTVWSVLYSDYVLLFKEGLSSRHPLLALSPVRSASATSSR